MILQPFTAKLVFLRRQSLLRTLVMRHQLGFFFSASLKEQPFTSLPLHACLVSLKFPLELLVLFLKKERRLAIISTLMFALCRRAVHGAAVRPPRGPSTASDLLYK